MAKWRVSAYSDEQRAQALAVLAACGSNVSEAARQTGLPRRTISYWSSKVSDPETREQARRVAREVVNVARLARRVAMEEVARASLDDRFEDLAHRCIVRSLV
jgi:transposase-like protein